ncbi:MAG: cyanophycin synthetase [Cyanobacteria bacterium J06623_5]
MKILKTQTLRGPNYWSIRYTKLIVVKLDLEDLAERPSNTIKGFYDGLVTTLPSLIEHFCSPGVRGGFLQRLQKGTMMGHIIEHIALELQTLVGMPVGFGRTRETATPGVYQVVFAYENEAAGRYAARAALRMCESILATGSYPNDELQQDLADLRELKYAASLGPSTEALVRAAEARQIPWMALEVRNLIQFGYGIHQKRIQASLTNHSNILSVELACDKEGTKRILDNAGIPVPKGSVVYSLRELEDTLDYLGGYPIVIKPLDGNHGRGITLNVQSWEQAEAAYDRAKAVSDGVIVEHHYQGRDHRILVVNHKVVAVAERVPAHVVGNGRNTIAELIDQVNSDPRRGDGHDNILTKINLDRTTDKLLESQNLTLDTVLDTDEICYLRETANLSTGGIAIDRTDEIHPETAWIAERVSRIIGLDVAGIDVVTTDISKTLGVADGVIVEVNAAPGLRMHVSPSVGVARNVGAPIIDMLFPPGKPTRIPIVAITGTNGKTTTTRLTAHIFRQAYSTVGFTTTDGIYIGNHLVEKGDTTGPQSARMILEDPTVDMAVLETARGGLLRSGMAFERCDVGIVLNVAADHLGIGDINTIDELAKLKAVVAEAVKDDGYAILNADDERVAAMANRVTAQVAYFSMDRKNPLVRSHLKKGGIAAVYEEGHISILQEDWLHRITKASLVPLTMGGRAPFMIANALAASLAGFVQGIKVEQIRAALHSFQPSASQIPGRMNLFNLGSYHVLVDYAHNPAGYKAMGSFVQNWPGSTIGVIGAPGDRRDEDFLALGKLAADIFDQVIIKEDDDTRGRERGEVADFIVQGLTQASGNGEEPLTHQVELDETTATNWALDNAPENGLVVILPESVSRAISTVSARGPVSEGFATVAAKSVEEPIVFNPVAKNLTEVNGNFSNVITASDVQSLNGASSASTTSSRT